MIQVITWSYYISGTLIAFNLLLLVLTILSDPGISEKTYLHYSKMWYVKNGDGEVTSSDEDDPEAGGSTGSSETMDDDVENNIGVVRKRK